MKLALDVALGILLGNLALDAVHNLEIKYALQNVQFPTPAPMHPQVPSLPRPPAQSYLSPPATAPAHPPAYVINESTGRRVDLNSVPSQTPDARTR